MSNLKKIRLELARDRDYPQGSSRHGYEFVAPIDGEGAIIPAEWKTHRDQCRVKRFWGDEAPEVGHLIRKPGGSWAFHYDIKGDADDDDSGYRFGAHIFRSGEYVSLREPDDEMRTFRVVSVTPLERS